MHIRRVLLAAPIVVFALFAVAFLIARPYFGGKPDQLTIGSGGEPERLNPILSTTVPASDVESFIFDSLLRYNENIEYEPAMARSFTLSQVSRLYFDSPEKAAAAAQSIREHQAQWKDASIESAEPDDDAVVLHLSGKGAGTAYQDAVFQWIPRDQLAKVQRWVAEIDNKDQPQDKPIASDALIAWIERNRPAGLVQPRVLYAWKNTSTTLEIYTVGATGPFIDDLYGKMARELGWKAGPATTQPAATATAPVSAPAAMQVRAAGPVTIQFDRDWDAQDEPQIVFSLRKGIKWHDGAPFSAADVQFTFQALMDERTASPRRSDFELIRSLSTPDDYTVVVVYKEPFSPCLNSWGMQIIPKHILAGEENIRNPVKSDFERHPIGTGPYKFESWQTGQQISLVRNDDYWEGKPHIERSVYRIIPDPTAMQLEFETGGYDLDLSGGLEPFQVKRYSADPRYTMYHRAQNQYSYIGWNLKNPLFEDRKVRQALAHAVNVPQIIQYIMYGHGTPSNGPYTPVTAWNDPDIQPIPYDPEKARRLLAEAGWKDTDGDGVLDKGGKPFRFNLITNNGNQIRRDISVLVQNDLRKIGIDVTVTEYEWAVFIKNYIDPRNFDACVLGWQCTLDADLYQIWHSSQIKLPRSLNHVSYANPRVDRLIERIRTQFDMEKVKRDCRELARLIYDDQPYLFLFCPVRYYPLAKGEFAVERPGPDGSWIQERIRDTKLGHMFYLTWWLRQERPAVTD